MKGGGHGGGHPNGGSWASPPKRLCEHVSVLGPEASSPYGQDAPFGVLQWRKSPAMDCLLKCREWKITYLIQLVLVAGEGEGEAKGQHPVLDLKLLHEAGQASGNVVEELEGQRQVRGRGSNTPGFSSPVIIPW